MVDMNSKNVQEAISRVLTQDHHLGFLSTDGQVIGGKPGRKILKIFVKRQFQNWNVGIGCIGASVIGVEPQGRKLSRKISLITHMSNKYINQKGPQEAALRHTAQYTGNQSEKPLLT